MKFNMITKNQSKMIQGIAISMMLFHHFFLDPNEQEFHFWNVTLTKNIAWFCKIALSLYAFVSGYGVFFVFARCDDSSFWTRLGKEYRCVLKKLGVLLLQYWYAIVVCIGINIVCCKAGTHLAEVLKSALLIDFSYYSTWWYMRQYVIMMLFAPLMDMMLTRFATKEKKYKRKFYSLLLIGMPILCIAGICFIPGFFSVLYAVAEEFNFVVLASFIVAYLLARYHVYERIADHIPESAPVRILLGVAIMIPLYLVRTRLATFPAYAKYDFIFAPLFVLGALLALSQVPVICRGLETFGVYCMYMWFVHTFVSDWTRNIFFKYSHSPLLFIILELALSFVFSCILQKTAGLLECMLTRKKA